MLFITIRLFQTLFLLLTIGGQDLSECRTTFVQHDSMQSDSSRKSSASKIKQSDTLYISAAEQKKRLTEELNSITLAYKKLKSSDASERIIHSAEHTFRLLHVIGKVLDKQGLFLEEMDDHRIKFVSSSKKSNQLASGIVNSITAMYSMYGTLAAMYTSSPSMKTEQKEVDDIHLKVASTIQRKASAMEIVASMAYANYKLLHIMLREADMEKKLTPALEGVQNSFLEGEKVAATDEDKFLNGIFRIFELTQIWAFAVDPPAKEDITKLLDSIIQHSKETQRIDEQIAVSLEHLYSMTHIVTLGLVKGIH